MTSQHIMARTELQVKISTGHVKLQVYKHISVLCTSKNKCLSLTSLYQDLDYTCKLIPKSKPTSQKNSCEIFKFKKISQRATILALLFGHFPGVLENDAGGISNCLWVFNSIPGGSIEGISGVLGRFQPFFSRLEPNFSRNSTYIFQILKCLGIRIEEKLSRRLWGFPCCQGAQFCKVVLKIVRICHEIWVKMGTKMGIWQCQCRCTDCHKIQSCPLLVQHCISVTWAPPVRYSPPVTEHVSWGLHMRRGCK